MKTKLTVRQKQMLAAAKASEDRNGGPGNWGYAPCGRGFGATMRSLVKLGLAFATGSEENIRGIVLTKSGHLAAQEISN